MSTGIITELIDCPQCGLPAQKDEYYVVGEERVTCNLCGYSHIKGINGTESSKGYGSIHYISKNEIENGSNQIEKIIRLKIPMDIIDRHKTIMNINENYDTTQSSFYIWNEEKKSLECLVGVLPRTIDEEYEEKAKEAEYYRSLQHERGYNSFS